MRVKSAFILLGTFSVSLGAQQVVELRPDAGCAQCRIEIVKGIALGDEDGEGIIEHSSVSVLPSGDFVFNATLSGESTNGLPLHRIGRDGRIALSFGASAVEYRPDIPYQLSRDISPAGGSMLWSAHRAIYQVDLLDAKNGNVVRSLRRDVDWFPPGTAPVRRGEETLEPKPMIFDVIEDSTGLLWVLIATADANWRDAISAGGPHGSQVIDDNGYRDTVLEVIDPVAGTVLATARMDERITQFVGPGLIGTVVEDDEGVRFRMWSVRLITASASR